MSFTVRSHNSGIFVRFRDPLMKVPALIRDRADKDQDDLDSNRALTAVHTGFEIQIDDTAKGDSRRDFYGVNEANFRLRKNRTGAIYKIPAKDFIPHQNRFDEEVQVYGEGPQLIPGPWYEFEITVMGDAYTVDLRNLDSQQVTRTSVFTNTDLIRGVAKENGKAIGHVGLQAYPNAPVAFRHIQVKELRTGP